MTKPAHRLPLTDNAAGGGLLLTAGALLGMGAVMVYSASAGTGAGTAALARPEVRHLFYAAMAAATVALLWRVDYRVLTAGHGAGTVATILLAVAVILSVLVLIPGVGAEINGARRWIRIPLGSFVLTFQPSEVLKLALVVYLACRLGRTDRDVRSFRHTFLPAAALLGVCVGLVAIEDFGTGAIIAAAAIGVMAVAGVRWYYLLTLAAPAAGAFYALVVCNPRRWSRIVAFTDPWDEANGFTWQLRQSLIAIGSGGIWGKGLGNGSIKLGFLPEDRTDFIFAIICEELGFIGAAMVLALFMTLLILCWRIGVRTRCAVGRLLASGIGVLIGIQVLLHVAVNIGWAPPTGMNLPLVGAGGTALLLVAAAVALVVSVAAHPHDTTGLQK